MTRKSDWSARILSIRNKITLSAVLLLSAMLLVTLLLANQMRRTSEALRWNERAAEARSRLNALDQLLRETEMTLDSQARQPEAAQLQNLLLRFSSKEGLAAEVARIRELLDGEDTQTAQLDQLQRMSDSAQWRNRLTTGNTSGFGEARLHVTEMRAATDRLATAHAQQMTRRNDAAVSGVTTTLINVSILYLLVVAITIIASQRLARRIVDPVGQMMLAAERLTLGERAPQVDDRAGDEIGQLARAFNRMAEKIAERENEILSQKHELDELHDFNGLLQTSASEEEIHRALLQKMRTLELSQAVILNRQSEEASLAVVASLKPFIENRDEHPALNLGYDLATETDDPRMMPEQVPLCRVVRAGREMLVQNVADDLLCADCRFGQHRGSSFCVPITAGGKTIGAMHLSSPKTNYWTTERQRLVKAFVDQAAPTINNLRLMKTLEDRTLIDEHTKVYNRRYLDEYLKKQIGQARRQEFPVSVMMLDIDYFKRLNDRYGHEAGDVVLKQFAAVISRSLREGEFIARYGGEEFTVVMNGMAKAAQTLAERLRKAVASLSFPQFAQQGEEVRLTMSIGIAEFPTNGQTPEDILKAADFALYRAKESGRNCVRVASRSLMAIKGAQITRSAASE